MLLAGCGRAKPHPPKPTSEPPTAHSANTGPISLVQYAPDRSVLWRASAEGSQISYGTDGAVRGLLLGVKGEIQDKKGAASKFTARKAYADQKKSVLQLMGGIDLESDRTGVRLKAEELRYEAKKRLVEASGKVTVSTDVYEAGPFNVIWATPDLRQFGTPDMFGGKTK